ncbi:hypothetical protein MSG28_015996 [Choristoneura fumiferana]|uniref:Uncharacterized protein n=1 Tax=Choristoneura fumiferana TaxID=7141 RepID=A0ACC0K4Y7_CHOFU|nr:hypothetical protein MSG28_015996 [Choristoneura fumiferana]
MKMNVKKTKVMVFERDETVTDCNIVIGDEQIEQVNEFVYLGSKFTRDGKCESDIERRVNAGNMVKGALHSFMNSRKVSNKARLAVHGGMLVPTLMYGSESWVWQKKHESRINAVEMRALRSMIGVKLSDRIRNSEIRKRCGLKEDVVTKIEKESGVDGGVFGNTSGEGDSKPLFDFIVPGINLPDAFNFGVPCLNQSLVYKCNACGLCFDREEVMFKHLISCSPITRITRIHCVCGLEFDTHNYDYHCEVHRQFNILKKKDVTVTHVENIDIGGMKKKFKKKEGAGSVAEFKDKIKASAVAKQKSCVVYTCDCRLSFERPEFLFTHLNNCDPGEKITRIHCMCGLEFDEDNYDYHYEVHRICTRLKVKKIAVIDEKIIPIIWMKHEFTKDDEKKAVKSTKDAQVQTVHLNEPFVKNSATELFSTRNGILEQLLGQKIDSVVIDTIESGIDGKESQTKISIIIAKASEKTVECPNKTNTGDKNNKVTDIGTSETTTSQKAGNDTTNDITAPTERDHGTDNQEKSDVINSSDPADGETKDINKQIEQLEECAKMLFENISAAPNTIITENLVNSKDSGTSEIIERTDRPYKINAGSPKNLDNSTNKTSTLTPTIPENEAIGNPNPKDSGTNVIIEPTERPNKKINNQENSDNLTNKTSTLTPTIPENKAIGNPDPKDSGTNVIIEPTERPNKMINNQENSDNLTNKTSTLTPTIPENEAIGNPDPKDSGTNVIIEPTEQPNKMINNQENSDNLTNKTSTLTPTIPENKAIGNPNPKDSGTNVIIEPIERPNQIINNQEILDISTNETCTSSELGNKAIDSPEPLEDRNS